MYIYIYIYGFDVAVHTFDVVNRGMRAEEGVSGALVFEAEEAQDGLVMC
jgi:hypothetical protein